MYSPWKYAEIDLVQCKDVELCDGQVDKSEIFFYFMDRQTV